MKDFKTMSCLATVLYSMLVLSALVRADGTELTQAEYKSGSRSDASTYERFSVPGDGTIVDKQTGLTWLRAANCYQLTHLTWDDAASKVRELKSGDCHLTDGSASGKWRLPSKDELISLCDGHGIVKNRLFEGVPTDYEAFFWTSTQGKNSGYAWGVSSSSCYTEVYEKNKILNKLPYVLPVHK